jgi:hypothetical protein
MRPFAWMAKCQKVDLYDQFYKYNVRYFDIRMDYDKSKDPIFKHGAMVWDVQRWKIFATLSTLADTVDEPVYVRLILENNFKSHDQAYKDKMFVEDCKWLEDVYNNLTFVGGRRKYDWKKLYDFKTEEPTLDDKYSSTTHPFGGDKNSILAKIDDLWPWLYAKLHNKKHYKEGTKEDVLFLDFVNIK